MKIGQLIYTSVIEPYIVRCATPQELAQREKDPAITHKHNQIMSIIAAEKKEGKWKTQQPNTRVEPPLAFTRECGEKQLKLGVKIFAAVIACITIVALMVI